MHQIQQTVHMLRQYCVFFGLYLLTQLAAKGGSPHTFATSAPSSAGSGVAILEVHFDKLEWRGGSLYVANPVYVLHRGKRFVLRPETNAVRGILFEDQIDTFVPVEDPERPNKHYQTQRTESVWFCSSGSTMQVDNDIYRISSTSPPAIWPKVSVNTNSVADLCALSQTIWRTDNVNGMVRRILETCGFLSANYPNSPSVTCSVERVELFLAGNQGQVKLVGTCSAQGEKGSHGEQLMFTLYLDSQGALRKVEIAKPTERGRGGVP